MVSRRDSLMFLLHSILSSSAVFPMAKRCARKFCLLSGLVQKLLSSSICDSQQMLIEMLNILQSPCEFAMASQVLFVPSLGTVELGVCLLIT